jgi:hypothetical protein
MAVYSSPDPSEATMSVDAVGRVLPAGEQHYISRHGRSWAYHGNLAGDYVTNRATRYDDGLIGPYASRAMAEAAARTRNDDEEIP